MATKQSSIRLEEEVRLKLAALQAPDIEKGKGKETQSEVISRLIEKEYEVKFEKNRRGR